MAVLQCLGIPDISNRTDGEIHLQLVVDLLISLRKKGLVKEVYSKAHNLIQIRSEPMLEELIAMYDWSKAEAQYAEALLVCHIKLASIELLKILNRKIRHKKKRERQTNLTIEDMKVAAAMAFLMSVTNNIWEDIEDAFIRQYGSMYFT